MICDGFGHHRGMDSLMGWPQEVTCYLVCEPLQHEKENDETIFLLCKCAIRLVKVLRLRWAQAIVDPADWSSSDSATGEILSTAPTSRFVTVIHYLSQRRVLCISGRMFNELLG